MIVKDPQGREFCVVIVGGRTFGGYAELSWWRGVILHGAAEYLCGLQSNGAMLCLALPIGTMRVSRGATVIVAERDAVHYQSYVRAVTGLHVKSVGKN